MGVTYENSVVLEVDSDIEFGRSTPFFFQKLPLMGEGGLVIRQERVVAWVWLTTTSGFVTIKAPVQAHGQRKALET